MGNTIVDSKGRVYGVGHVANPNHRRPALALKRGLKPVAEASNLAIFNPRVMHQGPTGTCEGHSHSAGIYTSLSAKGRPLSFVPSPLHLYNPAIALERARLNPHGFPPLQDYGTESVYVQMVMNHWGVIPMGELPKLDIDYGARNSDCSPLNVTQEPNLWDLENMGTRLVTGAYACLGVTDVKLALSNDTPVEWGGWVDTAFMEWTPSQGTYPHAQFSDKNGGGHSMLIVAHQMIANQLAFLLLNSWGPDWCHNGYIWVSADMVEQADELTALNSSVVEIKEAA